MWIKFFFQEHIAKALILEKNRASKGLRNGDDLQNSNETSINESEHFSFPYNLKIIKEVLDVLENEECVKDTLKTFDAMIQHERWALEMFDSFPKFPVGILYGNYYQLGNFDECIGSKQTAKYGYEFGNPIQGQYCLTDIHIREKLGNGKIMSTQTTPKRNTFNKTTIHWGICLPTSCSILDAQIFTKEVFASATDNLEVVSVEVERNKCAYEKTLPISYEEIIYGAIVGCFLLFIALATGLHIRFLRQRSRYVAYSVDSLRAQETHLGKEIITCFSVLHTTKKFLHTKRNELNLECICGIKVLSMMLIIVGHSLVFIIGGPIENKNFYANEIVRIENGQFTNNSLMVDSFLLMGGFLMCYLLLIELDKRKGRVNILVLYIARYIRLTPAYLVVLGFQTILLYRLGNGPFWESRVGVEQERCLNSWWTNILYINNYVNDGYLCMFQSWYLAVDYHLFILAPLIIYPLWRWRRFGELLLFTSTCISIALPFWITYKDNLDPTLLAYAPELKDLSTNFYFINVYIKTHMRAGSYCIGLFFGYLLHRIQSRGLKIPSYIIYLGWTLAGCFAVVSMYSIVIFLDPSHVENILENAIYASFSRVAWSLAVGWIALVCITDNAGVINKFLSWKPFIPLSRLTYCAYLLNGTIEVYNMGVLRQPTYLSKFELACKLLGHMCMNFSFAFVLCICFESPIHGLEKLLLTRNKRKQERHNATANPIEES